MQTIRKIFLNLEVSSSLFVLLIFISCQEEKDMMKQAPIVTTLSPDVSLRYVIFRGELNIEGRVEDYGFWLFDSTLSHHEKTYEYEDLESYGLFTRKVFDLTPGRFYHYQAFAKVRGELVVGDTVKFKPYAAEIADFHPREGVSGTTVTITGNNFTYVEQEDNDTYEYVPIVRFDSTEAEIVNYTNKTITVKIPTSHKGGFSTISVGINRYYSIPAEAQFTVKSQWRKVADFPGGPRKQALAFSVSGKGYIGLGRDDDKKYEDIWEYDPMENSWTQKNNIPESFDYETFFVDGSKVYFFNSFLNRRYIYDAEVDQWMAVSSNNEPRLGIGSTAFSIDGIGYLGFGGAWSDSFWKYNPISNVWQTLDFPGSGRGEAVGFTIGKNGFIVGGSNGYPLNDLWVFDAASDNWTQKQSLPREELENAHGFSLGGYGFVGLGGYYRLDQNGVIETGTETSLYKYDLKNDTWNAVQDFVGGGRSYGISFVIGEKAYYGLGDMQVDETTEIQSDIWEFSLNP